MIQRKEIQKRNIVSRILQARVRLGREETRVSGTGVRVDSFGGLGKWSQGQTTAGLGG